MVVGVPGEDFGGLTDAGEVQTFSFPFSGTPSQISAITQDTAGIAGGAESGDQFGATVLLGGFEAVTEAETVDQDFAIGSPGESIGSATGAGTVTIVNNGQEAGVGLRTVALAYQHSSGRGALGGTAESGDHAGAGLSAKAEPQSFVHGTDSSGGSSLVVAVPGEDDQGVDTGVVAVSPLSLCLCTTATNYTDSAGRIPGERYGVGAFGVSNGTNAVIS